jgi:hypothetical protein
VAKDPTAPLSQTDELPQSELTQAAPVASRSPVHSSTPSASTSAQKLPSAFPSQEQSASTWHVRLTRVQYFDTGVVRQMWLFGQSS